MRHLHLDTLARGLLDGLDREGHHDRLGGLKLFLDRLRGLKLDALGRLGGLKLDALGRLGGLRRLHLDSLRRLLRLILSYVHIIVSLFTLPTLSIL